MKLNKVLIYLLILVALGIYVYLGEIKQKEKEKARKEKAEDLVHLDRGKISKMSLSSADGKTIELQKINDTWVLTQPLKVAADNVAVSTLLYSFVDAEREKLIAEKDVKWKEFGLNDPSFTVTATTKDGTSTSLHFGAHNPSQTSYYVRVDDSPSLVLVADTLKNSLDKSVFHLREKSVLSIAPSDVDRVVMVRGAKQVTIQRTGPDEWEMVEPEKMRVKSKLMERSLRELSNLLAEDIIDKPTQPPQAYGLKQPHAKVTLEGKKLSQTLLIGNPVKNKGTAPSATGEEIYAQIEGKETLYAIPGRALRFIQADPEELRDRSLVQYEVEEADKLEITLEGTTSVASRDDKGSWTLEKPKPRKDAPAWLVSGLLWMFKDLQWTQTKEMASVDQAALHLDDPQLVVSIHLKRAQRPLTIKAGWPTAEAGEAQERDSAQETATEKPAKEPEIKPSETAGKESTEKPESTASTEKPQRPKKAKPPAEEPQTAPEKVYAVVGRPSADGVVYVLNGDFLTRLREDLNKLLEEKK